MAFYRCTICMQDGTVVAKGVTVSLEVPSRDDRWYGTVSVTHLANLESGHTYLLELEDGRKAEFMVRRNTFAGDTNRAVAIQGASPLK